MNSFEADPTEPGAVSEPERLLQPVAEGRRITVMLAAFEGWNDAGEAASDALRYLNKLWGGKKVGSIDADEYYDFQFTRPTIRRTASGERKIKWPSTRIFKASVPDSNVDVIFVQGTEPSYKWRAYTAELLVHAEALHVDYVILVGALLADVPHSRPIPVSTSTDDNALRERMDFEASQYEGPVGIVGVLGEVALLAGLPTVSLWAAVPHYVAQAPSPKAQLAILNRIEEPTRGSAAWTNSPPRIPRLLPMCASWRRPRTPPTSRRPAANRSPVNSSATSSAATKTNPNVQVAAIGS
jgi:hypothetical protein